jgi:hypothetical protein
MTQRSADPLALVMGDVDMVRAPGAAGIASAFFGSSGLERTRRLQQGRFPCPAGRT